MITEPILVLILHCSRCNTPWLTDECEAPGLWASPEQIAEAFRTGPCADWLRLGGRYLCAGCWYDNGVEAVEAGGVGGAGGDAPARPLEAIESVSQR